MNKNKINLIKKNYKFITICVLGLITTGLLIISLLPNSQKNVDLPNPDLEGIYSLDSVLRHQQFSNNLSTKDVNLNEITQILWGMQGINRGSSFRTAPSAGAIYPLDLYIVHNGTSNLNRGFYKYLPEENGLKYISSQHNISMEYINENNQSLSILKKIDTFIIIAGDYEETILQYGENADVYVDLEVGHVIDNCILQLIAINMSTIPVYNFQQSELQQSLNIPETPYVLLPLGITPGQVELETSSIYQKSVEKALFKRRSVRNYIEGSIIYEDVSELLNLSLNTPLTQNFSHQIELHLISENVDEFEPGIYSLDNSNRILQESGNFLGSLQRASISGGMIGSAQAALVISMNQTYLNSIENNSLAYRILAYKIGIIAQNFWLKCCELGLGTVSVGGIYPTQVAEVLNQTGKIVPVYIMPIGLTPDYLSPGVQYIEFTVLGSIFSFVAFGIFIGTNFLTLKPIKRYIIQKYRRLRRLHCYTGIVSLALINMHYVILHGLANEMIDLINPITYINGLIHFFQYGFLMTFGTSFHSGHVLANFAILMINLATLTGIMLALKKIRKKRKIRAFHKTTVLLAIIFMIVHIFINSFSLSSSGNSMMFLYLNALIFEIYFLIRVGIKNPKNADQATYSNGREM